METVTELPVRIPTSRRGRVVVKLRDDAYTLRLMRAAMGDHECRPLNVPRETFAASDTGSGAK